MSLEAKAELLKTELQQRNENDRKAEMVQCIHMYYSNLCTFLHTYILCLCMYIFL